MRRLPTIMLLMSLGCAGEPDGAPLPERPDATAQASPPSGVTDSTTGFGSSGEWVLTPFRIGPVELGISLADVLPQLEPPVDTVSIADGCVYLTPRQAPAGVSIMAEGRRIVRADVRSGDTATPEGARIGDTEQRILLLYPSARRVPHKYTAGSYLVVLPAPADTLRRYVFETDGERVTVFRAGLYPPVEYVEGCA